MLFKVQWLTATQTLVCWIVLHTHGGAYIKSASLTVATLAESMIIMLAKSALPLCSDHSLWYKPINSSNWKEAAVVQLAIRRKLKTEARLSEEGGSDQYQQL